MKVEKTGIYVDLKELHKLLYRAQFTMTKGDRIIMGNRLLDLNQELVSLLSRATNETDKIKKAEYIDDMLGAFDALRLNLQTAADMTMFKDTRQTVDRDSGLGQRITPLVLEIFKRIANIDEGINKWRSATRARSIPDKV